MLSSVRWHACPNSLNTCLSQCSKGNVQSCASHFAEEELQLCACIAHLFFHASRMRVLVRAFSSALLYFNFHWSSEAKNSGATERVFSQQVLLLYHAHWNVERTWAHLFEDLTPWISVQAMFFCGLQCVVGAHKHTHKKNLCCSRCESNQLLTKARVLEAKDWQLKHA